MPLRPCPVCKAETPRLLSESSKDLLVWYYRCAVCGHVWSVEKLDGKTIRHVTPLPESDKRSD
jgi:uncharacterized Zn finger protein